MKNGYLSNKSLFVCLMLGIITIRRKSNEKSQLGYALVVLYSYYGITINNQACDECDHLNQTKKINIETI